MNGLGDALVDVLLRAVNQRRPRLRVVAEWLVEVARPPRGVRLVADDGAEYSGIVFVEHNEPMLMVARCVKAPRHPQPRSSPPVPYSRPFDEESWNNLNDEPFS